MKTRTPQLAPPGFEPNLFRELCAAAVEFQNLAPWEHLFDSDLLGFHDPVTGQLRIACVLGNAGEVFALVVYRHEQGLRWILSVALAEEEPDLHDPNFAFSQDCLKVEFVPRRELDRLDLARLRQIGFRPAPSGRRMWPAFRSHVPGGAPWHLEQSEAELMLADLRKATAFARMVVEHEPGLFENRRNEEVPFYPPAWPDNQPLRAEQLEWRSLALPVERTSTPIRLAEAESTALTSLPLKKEFRLELDCIYSPGIVGEKPRPYFPWLVLAADAATGFIFRTELHNSQTVTIETAVAAELPGILRQLKCRPGTILCSRSGLADALKDVAKSLGISIRRTTRLPNIEQAYASLRLSLLGQF